MENLLNKVAVIGMSGVFPEANDIAEFYQNLCTGKDSVVSISSNRIKDTNQLISESYQIIGSLNEVDKFDHKFFGISKKDAQFIDPIHRLTLELSCKAIEDAGYSLEQITDTETGVFLGAKSQPEYYKLIEDLSDSAVMTGNLPSITAGRVAYHLGLKGPAYMYDTACSSSLVAIHEACQKLISNEVEFALAGGVNILFDFPKINENIDTLGIASPDGKARAFDEKANGTAMGEGGGIVLLKRLDNAIADNDKIIAVILGSATNQDGNRSNGITAPSPTAQTEVILKAWKKAQVEPSTITYIEAHGTGTKLGDPIEIQGISDAYKSFTEKKDFVHISALKTNIGHLDNAAGVAGFIKAVLGLKYKQVFPSLHFTKANPFIDFENSAVKVNTTLQPWNNKTGKPLRCGVSSFGLSGTNAHVVLEEYESASEKTELDTGYLLKVSAKNSNVFRNYTQNIKSFLEKNSNWDDIIYTLNTGRADYEYRQAFSAKTKSGLLQQLIDFNSIEPENLDKQKLITVALLSDSGLDERIIDDFFQKNISISKHIEQYWSRCEGQLAKNVLFQLALLVHGQQIGIKYTTIIANGCGKLTKQLFSNEISFEQALERIQNADFDQEPIREDRLRDAIEKLSRDGATIFLEIGFSNTLSQSIRKLSETSKVIEFIAPQGTIQYDKLYNSGLKFNWQKIYNAKQYHKVDAPTYPFERVRCWAFEPKSENTEELSALFYNLDWQETSNLLKKTTTQNKFVIFYNSTEVNIIEEFRRQKQDVIAIKLSETFRTLPDGNFEINADDIADYLKLGNILKTNKIATIINLIGFSESNTINQQMFFCRGLVDILKNENTKLVFGTYRGVSVKNSPINPNATAALGVLKAMIADFPSQKIYGVDFEKNDAVAAVTTIREIVAQEPELKLMSFRDNKIYIPVFDSCTNIIPERHIIAPNDTYLITGGLGFIGVELCKFLTKKSRVNLIILGRKAANNEGIKTKLTQISKGALAVKYYEVDFKNEEETNRIYDEVQKEFGKIDGIFHLAGLGISEQNFFEKPYSNTDDIITPKVAGTHSVQKAAALLKAKFVVLFSSLNVVVPQKNSVDYTAANAYLDAFAVENSTENCHIVSINWPGWQVAEEFTAPDAVLRPITFEKGFDAMLLAIKQTQSNLTIADLNILKFGLNPFFTTRETLNSISQSMTFVEINQDDDKLKTVNSKEGIQQKILEIWQAVLKEDEIGFDEDFFEIGGHSLNGTQVANRISKELNIEITLDTIFENGTINELTEVIYPLIKAVEPVSQHTPIPQTALSESYSLSDVQKRIWFLGQLNESKIAYNMTSTLVIKGCLDVVVFEKAFNHLWKRYDILRTNFKIIDGEPRQVISDSFQKNFFWEYDNGLLDTQSIEQRIEAEKKYAFDLENDALMRVTLLKNDTDEHILILLLHHLVADGWSLNILFKELWQLYNTFLENKTPHLEPLSIQYRDFVAWQSQQANQPNAELSKEFWLKEFSGDLPILELPTDKPRPAVKSFKGATYSFKLDSKLSKQVGQYCEKTSTTPFMFFQAMLTILLNKYTNQQDIIIGTPLSGRNHHDLESQVGLFLNIVGIRNQITNKITIQQYINQVKEHTLQVYNHQSYSFDAIIEALNLTRDLGRSPLFDVLLVVQNHLQELTASSPNINIEPFHYTEEVSKYDLSLYVEQQAEAFELTFEYRTDLFEVSTVQLFAEHFSNLIGHSIEQPNIAIGKVKYGSEAESKLLTAVNEASNRTYDLTTKTINAFEEQVAKTPEKIALKFGETTLSYRLLNEAANKVAHTLKNDFGILPNDLVGIKIERSEKMLIAILAILKTGAAYLPIATDLPQERIAYIVDDSQIKYLIKNADVVFETHQQLQLLDIETLLNSTSPTENLNIAVEKDSRMYVMYTSGSTGKPKGVEIKHSSVRNFLLSMQESLCMQAKDSLLAVTTYIFDISILEFFLPITNGATLILTNQKEVNDPNKLISLLNHHQPDFMQATPSLWQMLIDVQWEGSKQLNILCGGEKLSRELGEKLLENNKSLWNLYGPTETTVWSMIKRIASQSDLKTIGKPIANTQIYIVNGENRSCGVGIWGEICIAGAGLALGYLNKPELTVTKFKLHDGQLLYHTGDKGRWTPDGEIEFLGRIDYQVKINGYRVELTEIEENISSYIGVRQAVVLLNEDDNYGKELIAYLTSDSEPKTEGLVRHLRAKLPEYMVPKKFVLLNDFPMTPNKKINRNDLKPELGKNLSWLVVNNTAQNDTEKKIEEIIGKVLKVSPIDTSTNLFDVGLNSVRVVVVFQLFNEAFGNIIEIHDIFSNPSIKKLAVLVEKRSLKAENKPQVIFQEVDF